MTAALGAFTVVHEQQVIARIAVLLGLFVVLAVVAYSFARYRGQRLVQVAAPVLLVGIGVLASAPQLYKFHSMWLEGSTLKVKSLASESTAVCENLAFLITHTRGGCYFRVFRDEDLLFSSVEGFWSTCREAQTWFRQSGCTRAVAK
jgi:hypothetical protein